jgi:hypothetical protein
MVTRPSRTRSDEPVGGVPVKREKTCGHRSCFPKEKLGLEVRPDHVSPSARAAKIDLTGPARNTDPWQPKRIVKKQFPATQ